MRRRRRGNGGENKEAPFQGRLIIYLRISIRLSKYCKKRFEFTSIVNPD